MTDATLRPVSREGAGLPPRLVRQPLGDSRQRAEVLRTADRLAEKAKQEVARAFDEGKTVDFGMAAGAIENRDHPFARRDLDGSWVFKVSIGPGPVPPGWRAMASSEAEHAPLLLTSRERQCCQNAAVAASPEVEALIQMIERLSGEAITPADELRRAPR